MTTKKKPFLNLKEIIVWAVIAATFCILGFVVKKGSTLTFLSRVILIALYALALNIQFGYGGMINLGSALYFGLSGYLIIIFVARMGIPLWIAIIMTLVIEVAFATLFGYITLKRGMMTFMFLNMGICQLLATFISKTTTLGGQTGLMANVCPAWLSDKQVKFFVILAVGVICGTLLYLLTKSPLIASLKGARDNRERLTFLGVNTNKLLLVVFVLSSFFMGIAGVLYVLLYNSISTTQMSADISLQALLMCVMGGSTTFVGPIVGAVMILCFNTYMPKITHQTQLFMGVLMLIFIYFIPQGLIDPNNKVVRAVAGFFKKLFHKKEPEAAATDELAEPKGKEG